MPAIAKQPSKLAASLSLKPSPRVGIDECARPSLHSHKSDTSDARLHQCLCGHRRFGADLS